MNPLLAAFAGFCLVVAFSALVYMRIICRLNVVLDRHWKHINNLQAEVQRFELKEKGIIISKVQQVID